MNKISFNKFINNVMVNISIENVFSNYISCVFCNKKIIFYEDIITPIFYNNNSYRNKLVQNFNLNRYENTILLFDCNYMLFIYIEDQQKKDRTSTFLLWNFILEILIKNDEIFNNSTKKVLLYKFNNELLKL